jgi:outer membrane protein assembly factor BamA
VNARGIVESAEITGIDESEISRDVREAIAKLSGQPFDQKAADDLVGRIQQEKPDFTATTRLLPGNQPDRVKVVFQLEKTSSDPNSNVNARYTVERVEVQGYDESKLSQTVRDAIKQLVGEKFDQEKASELQNEIDDDLRPRHYAKKRVTKGTDRQHVVIIYEIQAVKWIPFVDLLPQRLVYHSKQNFSASFTPNIFDNRDNRFYFGLADDQDLLIERFAGLSLGFESTKVGTDRLGIALRYSRFHDRWQPSTVSADRNAVYRERNTFDPSITFAFDPRLRLTAGVTVSELQMQYPAIHNTNSNAAVAALNFHSVWGKTGGDKHSFQATYEVHAGNHTLDSDFIYTRHLVESFYVYGHKKNDLILRFGAGTISGNAPLFEQFSLGNTSTLRGWNKFDIAPAGGNRMAHATVQYNFGGPGILEGHFQFNDNPGRDVDFHLGVHVFYDVGAVGDRGSPIKARHSVGVGFGESHFFAELAFPIRSNRVQPVFITGVRF